MLITPPTNTVAVKERTMSPQYNPDHYLCSVVGCQRYVYRSRRCFRHLRQLGPDTNHDRKRRSPMERFWSHVDKNGPLWNGTPCWVWTGAVDGGGYGHFGLPSGHRGGYLVKTHRFAYETLVGPIPSGLELDHLCRNHACANPAHLEAVTRQVNVIRGVGFCAVNAKKTYCNKGHEFTSENTRMEGKGRRCIACRRVTQQRADRKRRGPSMAGPQKGKGPQDCMAESPG